MAWLLIVIDPIKYLGNQVGWPWNERQEQALPDLTASILATFRGMSNMFLHFPQVIDSTEQEDGMGR